MGPSLRSTYLKEHIGNGGPRIYGQKSKLLYRGAPCKGHTRAGVFALEHIGKLPERQYKEPSTISRTALRLFQKSYAESGYRCLVL